MTRPLQVLEAGDGVLDALREALSGGPAFLPVPDGWTDGGVTPPPTVEQRIALVVETSGTTGRPKRVALSADALLANAAAGESALGGPGQWVLALPTHYIAGLNVLTRSITGGIDPVRVTGDHFTAASFVAAADRMSVPERYTSLVPAQLAALLDDAEARDRLRGFRRVLVGGQATPQALVDDARERGIHVTRSYGSSETSGGCVYDGVPVGATVVDVVDGEVRLGGPSVAEGYLGDPARTDERFVELGGVRWFRTADAGTVDADGRLTVTGRLDDVVISGGVKVSLGAVERVLREQPGLADAVVVPVAHERWGEAPLAFTAASVSPEAAARGVARVGEALGAPARPVQIVRLEELPVLASGKPDRAALRALAAERGHGGTDLTL